LLSIDHWGIDLGVIYWLVSGPYSAPTSSMSHVMPPQLRSGRHMGSMCPCHVIDPRDGKLRRIRWRRVDCIRIGGSTLGENWLKILYTPRMYPRATSQPTGGRWGPIGPIGVRSNRPWVGWSWPSTCGHSLVHGSIPEVLSLILSTPPLLWIEEALLTFWTHNFTSLLSLLVPRLGSWLE
jgi:hypothetical protein